MNMHRRQRIAVGLTLVGLGAVAALGGGAAAHAQSGSLLLSAYRSVSGSAEQVVISGSGFSPGSSLTIEVLDRTSGAVLATTSVQATAGTLQSGYITEPQPVCTPLVVSPLHGAYGGSAFAPGGGVIKVGGGNWESKPLPGAGGNWDCQPQCQFEVVSVPQTTYLGGGYIATSVEVASTDSLTVEAIDTASGAVISQAAAW
jgi:hypothetical protein